MEREMQLGVAREGETVRLTSPAVGWLTRAVPAGHALVAGERAGVLVTLDRSFELLVPDGVAGIVRSAAPDRVREPVGFGAVLYELAPLAGASAQPDVAAENAAAGTLVFRSPQAGRYWHRPSPAEPALVHAGQVIERGHAVGLIEVMKTFALVPYSPAGGLPARARVVRVIAGDGAEVQERSPLFEVEPA
jgi:biotin carboxyl carrier protein